MGIKDKIVNFASNIGTISSRNSAPYSTKKITTDMTDYINKMSQFGEMTEEEVYEQMHANEPDIGGGIDRVSTMVSRSFKGVSIDSDDELTEAEKETLRLAKDIVKNIDVKTKLETYAEVMMIHGSVCGEYKKGSLKILPNKYVTFLDDLSKKDMRALAGIDLPIDEANYMLLYEADPTLPTKIINKNDFVHIKYKNTPLFVTDMMGRETYGIYPVSPLQRLVMTVWHKRQLSIIDITHRWRNVPREHHKLSADAFTLDRFTGNTKAEKLVAAATAAATAITAHNTELKSMRPDQSITTLDNMTIDVIETKAKHTDSNDLMAQLDAHTWLALNMPESIVNGKGGGSYASEINVGNYFSTKMIEIATKFEPILLRMIKDRISKIDGSLPVDKLNLEFELSMSASEIEMYRQCAIMASIGEFTSKEIRDVVGFEELTEEQKNNLVRNGQEKSVGDVMRDVGRSTDIPEHPDTPNSDEKHKADAGQLAEQKSVGIR